MKNFFFFILIFLNFTNLNAHEDIFFLDIDFLLKNSNSGNEIVKKLQKKNDENIKEIEKYENELKDLENDISNKKNILSDDELKNQIDNLKKKINIYKSIKDKKTKEFKTLRSKELNNYFNKISPLIEEFMSDKSIKIIFDKKNIFIANSNYDITQQVIDYINKKELND